MVGEVFIWVVTLVARWVAWVGMIFDTDFWMISTDLHGFAPLGTLVGTVYVDIEDREL